MEQDDVCHYCNILNDLCTEIVIELLVNTVEDAMILMCNYGYL